MAQLKKGEKAKQETGEKRRAALLSSVSPSRAFPFSPARQRYASALPQVTAYSLHEMRTGLQVSSFRARPQAATQYPFLFPGFPLPVGLGQVPVGLGINPWRTWDRLRGNDGCHEWRIPQSPHARTRRVITARGTSTLLFSRSRFSAP
jgi:hypothetical protein